MRSLATAAALGLVACATARPLEWWQKATPPSAPDPAEAPIVWPAWPAVLPDDDGLIALLPPGYDFDGAKIALAEEGADAAELARAYAIVRSDLDGDGHEDVAFVIEPDPHWADPDDAPCAPGPDDDACWPRTGPRVLVIALQREGRVERALANPHLIAPNDRSVPLPDAFHGLHLEDDQRFVLDFAYGMGVEASGETFTIGWHDGAFVLLAYASRYLESGENGWSDALGLGWSVDYVTGKVLSWAEQPEGPQRETVVSLGPCKTFLRAADLRGGPDKPRSCPRG